MKVFENESLIVTNGLFRNLRVIDKRNGRTIKPDADLGHKCLEVWMKLSKFRYHTPQAKRLAEAHMFSAFGNLCLNPADPIAVTFHLSPDYIAQEFARRGEISALSLEMDELD